jgi:uncharacterized protein (TIGR02058 family)
VKRYIVEMGMGADLHGGDATKAAQRAVRDAMSHCCLCGLEEILKLENSNKIRVMIKIGCPDPERVNGSDIEGLIPFGKAAVEVVSGGLTTRGMHVPSFGEGDQIVIAVASLTVCIEQ